MNDRKLDSDGRGWPARNACTNLSCWHGNWPRNDVGRRTAGLRLARDAGAFVNAFRARGRGETPASCAQNRPPIQNASRRERAQFRALGSSPGGALPVFMRGISPCRWGEAWDMGQALPARLASRGVQAVVVDAANAPGRDELRESSDEVRGVPERGVLLEAWVVAGVVEDLAAERVIGELLQRKGSPGNGIEQGLVGPCDRHHQGAPSCRLPSRPLPVLYRMLANF